MDNTFSLEQKNVFSEGVEKIREKIISPEIKVVSFDVFDTLLLRPVSTPVDIFRLIENKIGIPNFHNMRVAAEAEARKVKNVFVQDITLDEIYEAYSHLFHYSQDEIEFIKKEELEAEYTLLYPRRTAKYLFNEAKKAGKEIIIVSDMYLPGKFVDKCLKKNGYTGYTHLYVSSETGVLKSSKLMYQYVLEEFEEKNVKAEEIIHIGDNKRSDVDCAIASGLLAAHLPKAIDVRNGCKQLKRVYEFVLGDVLNSNNAMLYGLIANLYFDDPFIPFEKNSFFNGKAKLMGYWFAPLMIGFTKWFIEKIEEKQIEQLLFIWRDGYLPQKLFEIMRPYFSNRQIEMKKIYMGRTMRMPFLAKEKNGFFKSFFDYPYREECTVDSFIKDRLLCTDENQYKEILSIFQSAGYLDESSLIGKFEKYRGILCDLEPYFDKNSADKIEIYSKYLMSVISPNRKTALFDRSPRGKSSRFLEDNLSIYSMCITTEIYDTPYSKLDGKKSYVASYLEYGSSYINKMGRIWAMLFERIISDTAPGFADVVDDSDGKFSILLDSETKSEEDINADNIIICVQNSIIEFAELFSKIFSDYLPYVVIDRHGVFDYAIEVLSCPHKNDATLITNLYPDRSGLAPIDGNTFVNWYNRKFKGSIKPVKKQKPQNGWDYVRTFVYELTGKIGIQSQVQKIYYLTLRKFIKPPVTFASIQAETDRYILALQQKNFEKITVLFVGSVPGEVSPFFNQIFRNSSKLNLLFVAAGFMKIPQFFDFPCIGAPSHFSFWGMEGYNLSIKIPAEIRRTVKEKEYLQASVKRRMLRGYSESIATLLAFEAERYYRALIEMVSPKLLLVWNNWGNNSSVPSSIAKEKGIPVISAERGFLEGTIMLSPDGYGKDEINTEPQKFSEKIVDYNEIVHARSVLSFLKQTGFNRYQQPNNKNLERMFKKLNKNRPNVLLIGAFDCENPSYPITHEAKETYGAVFGTSFDAAVYLSKLAKRYKWNLIYKPHPLMDKIDHSRKRRLPSNVLCINNVNINELIDLSDVIVCLVSGVSYISLIREKPLVELAYTTLKGKGCCYEVESVDDVANKIMQALKEGFTPSQKEAFERHVAQANKYYYYDDLGIRKIRFGRSISCAISYLENYV